MSVIDIDVVDDHERFRAELASVRPDGRRKWIYARKPEGRFTTARTIVAIVLLAFLVLSPFVHVGGLQFMLLNVVRREFVILGYPFWPNDFYLIALSFLALLVSIVLFTATIGRVWCGWLCPQTIFLETIFRRLEWAIEGGPKEQAARHAGPWTIDRTWRFVVKNLLFWAVSFGIANVFLAYLISSDTLLSYVYDGPFTHLDVFIPLVLFTSVFFLVFARFREQACVIVCPYGRFMSALVDENTIAVTYDFTRGEQRSKWTKADTEAKRMAAGESFTRASGHGDCVDCFQCVTVCPTGIDIRNGIQLECVNCTACIDACDTVMDKVGLPRGLIRYTSKAAVEEGKSSWLSTRVKAYALVWIVLMSVVISLFVMRNDLDVLVLRQEGTTWVRTPAGTTNFYRLQIINKTSESRDVTVDIIEPKGAIITMVPPLRSLEPHSISRSRFLITIPDSVVGRRSDLDIHLVVRSGTTTISDVSTTWLTGQ